VPNVSWQLNVLIETSPAKHVMLSPVIEIVVLGGTVGDCPSNNLAMIFLSWFDSTEVGACDATTAARASPLWPVMFAAQTDWLTSSNGRERTIARVMRISFDQYSPRFGAMTAIFSARWKANSGL
jgi:hypothetical protein